MPVDDAGKRKTGPDTTNWAEHSAVGDISTGRRFKAVQQVPMKTAEAIDSGDSTITYYGFTKFGVATSEALWRILRENTTTGLVEAADNDDKFDNVWDNREALSYG